ncbi:hypothetical protein QAD02_005148 [Eretmocerus hayati]|uniref:Uncharacterized protein n=1 Tax=Eretmocerus hayati TaxID=131215 RepID=A0ACC2NTF7_9HYME|nr:hypothetical protein QAD02_005148 [Eretmocerus hayati]
MRLCQNLLLLSLFVLIIPCAISVLDENGNKWDVIYGKREEGDHIIHSENYRTVKDKLPSGKTVYTKIVDVGPSMVITCIKARFKASDNADTKILRNFGAGPLSHTYIFVVESATKGRITPEMKVYGKPNPKLNQYMKPERKN